MSRAGYGTFPSDMAEELAVYFPLVRNRYRPGAVHNLILHPPPYWDDFGDVTFILRAAARERYTYNAESVSRKGELRRVQYRAHKYRQKAPQYLVIYWTHGVAPVIVSQHQTKAEAAGALRNEKRSRKGA